MKQIICLLVLICLVLTIAVFAEQHEYKHRRG